MHPKLPFRSVVAPTHKLLERRYALRLVVIPCQYLTSPSPFLQTISPSPSSHISSVAVPHLLHHRIHTYCPASLPPCLSAAVFTSDLVFRPHYPVATIRPQVVSRSLSIFSQSVAVLTTHFAISVVSHLICCRPTSPLPPYQSLLSCISSTVLVRSCLHLWTCILSLPLAYLLWSLLHYFPSFCVLRRCCLSTFFGRILSSLFIVLYYTACSALIHTTFLTLRSDLLTTLFFSILTQLFYLCVMFSLHSDLPRFSPLAFTLTFSNIIISLSSVWSNLLFPYLICSTLISPLIIWSTCSDLLWSDRSDLLCLLFLWTF